MVFLGNNGWCDKCQGRECYCGDNQCHVTCSKCLPGKPCPRATKVEVFCRYCPATNNEYHHCEAEYDGRVVTRCEGCAFPGYPNQEYCMALDGCSPPLGPGCDDPAYDTNGKDGKPHEQDALLDDEDKESDSSLEALYVSPHEEKSVVLPDGTVTPFNGQGNPDGLVVGGHDLNANQFDQAIKEGKYLFASMILKHCKLCNMDATILNRLRMRLFKSRCDAAKAKSPKSLASKRAKSVCRDSPY